MRILYKFKWPLIIFLTGTFLVILGSVIQLDGSNNIKPLFGIGKLFQLAGLCGMIFKLIWVDKND
jgi:hypothetical protein